MANHAVSTLSWQRQLCCLAKWHPRALFRIRRIKQIWLTAGYFKLTKACCRKLAFLYKHTCQQKNCI